MKRKGTTEMIRINRMQAADSVNVKNVSYRSATPMLCNVRSPRKMRKFLKRILA